MREKLSAWSIPLLAALGLADSFYLAVLHFQDELPPCGDYTGCADVNTSAFAEIFGIPIAALGAVLYLGILLLGLLRVRATGRTFLWATLAMYGLVLASTVFMVYLTVIELFVLQAICYWCVGLALITLALLVLLIRELRSLDADPIVQAS